MSLAVKLWRCGAPLHKSSPFHSLFQALPYPLEDTAFSKPPPFPARNWKFCENQNTSGTLWLPPRAYCEHASVPWINWISSSSFCFSSAASLSMSCFSKASSYATFQLTKIVFAEFLDGFAEIGNSAGFDCSSNVSFLGELKAWAFLPLPAVPAYRAETGKDGLLESVLKKCHFVSFRLYGSEVHTNLPARSRSAILPLQQQIPDNSKRASG